MATTAQDEALDKAKEVLGEHFDNFVIVADAPDVEYPDEDQPSLFYRRKGSTWTCCGLMDFFKAYLLQCLLDTPSRGEEK